MKGRSRGKQHVNLFDGLRVEIALKGKVRQRNPASVNGSFGDREGRFGSRRPTLDEPVWPQGSASRLARASRARRWMWRVAGAPSPGPRGGRSPLRLAESPRRRSSSACYGLPTATSRTDWLGAEIACRHSLQGRCQARLAGRQPIDWIGAERAGIRLATLCIGKFRCPPTRAAWGSRRTRTRLRALSGPRRLPNSSAPLRTRGCTRPKEPDPCP